MYCLYRFSSRSREEGEDALVAARAARAAAASRCAAGSVAPRHVHRDPLALRELGERAPLVVVARLRPRIDRAVAQRCARGRERSSASSYSSTAPKPLHVGHAPRGLLNENSCGVGAGARVPSFGHSKRSVKREPRRPARRRTASATGSVNRMTASPSPSRNAVPTASASRPRASAPTTSRSTTTSSSLREREVDVRGQQLVEVQRSRRRALTRTKPCARRFSTTTSCVTSSDSCSGNGDVEARARGQREHRVGHRLHGVGLAARGRTSGRACGRRAPRAGAGSRRSRSRCRRWSATSWSGSSARSRRRARARRSSRRRASPCARGTAARTPRATRRSGAAPRRRSCRRRATTCPSRTGPVMTVNARRGISRSKPLRLCCRAPRTTIWSFMAGNLAAGGPNKHRRSDGRGGGPVTASGATRRSTDLGTERTSSRRRAARGCRARRTCASSCRAR